MNILVGKDVLKFFSKNKKGVSVPEEYEKKFPNADTKRIRKDNDLYKKYFGEVEEG